MTTKGADRNGAGYNELQSDQLGLQGDDTGGALHWLGGSMTGLFRSYEKAG